MAYLVQVWRGIPQSGGLGWVTYGGTTQQEGSRKAFFYAARIRPNYSPQAGDRYTVTVETFGNDGFVITGDSIKTYRLMLLWQGLVMKPKVSESHLIAPVLTQSLSGI